MTLLCNNKKTDKEGYSEFYKDKVSHFLQECDNPGDYVKAFEKKKD